MFTKMETNTRVNVSGSIKSLEVNGEPLRLPRAEYILSSVRNTASNIKADTGRAFRVKTTDKEIIVVRVS